MGTVWISQVARCEDLMRLDFFHQINDDFDIVFTHGIFTSAPRFIKGQIKEMDMVIVEAAVTCPGARFSPPDQPFDGTNVGDVHFIRLLVVQKLEDLFVLFVQFIFEAVVGTRVVVFLQKLDKTQGIIIMYSDVARSLIRDVYIVTLFHQAQKGTTH